MKNLDLNIFPFVNKSQWSEYAKNQLKGANPAVELAWENDANLALEGYYDPSDISELAYLTDFFQSLNSHKWRLYENISTEDPILANENSLKALIGGCDGIILHNPKSSDFDQILNGVDHKICDVSVISSQKFEHKGKITGFELSPQGNCLKVEETKNPIKQLLEIFSTIRSESYIHRTAMTDFFLEIATLRSLRYLLSTNGHTNTLIHSNVPTHDLDDHQWFLNTTGGLSSILGGTHSVDFPTKIGDTRISRNVGNLIREESGIEEYSDQCGGSYYIEVLTHKIIQEALDKLK